MLLAISSQKGVLSFSIESDPSRVRQGLPLSPLTSVVHQNLGLSSLAHSTARNSQFAQSRATVMHGRVSFNSENPVGDPEAGGQRFCVPGETKDESAHPQRTPVKLHDETWAGLLRDQGPRIFREVEIAPGCAVAVACPSCPDLSPEPPGPSKIIWNMLGWSLEEETERYGVWLFRGALHKEKIFFFPCRSWRLGQEGIVPHSVGGSL